MYRLTRLYLAEHWRRDTIMLLLMPAVALAIYLFYRYSGSYLDLGGVRHRVAQWWVFGAIVYASTLFADYSSPRHAYSGLLLPLPVGVKFGFALLRSLILFPLLAAILLLGVDMAISLSGRISAMTLAHSTTLLQCMTYTSLPLYHMPVMPYYLVSLVAIVTLIRSASGWRQAVTVAISCIVVYLLLGWGPGEGDYPVHTVYPFLAGSVTLTGSPGSVWCQPVSWSGLPMKAVEAVSCLWLLLVPICAYVISYLNIKEASLRR